MSYSFGYDWRQSFTHSITNQVFLSRLEIFFDPKEFSEGVLSKHALLQFLHEASHHNCNFSPVGAALYFLDSKCRSLLEAGNPQWMKWYLKQRVAQLMLNPISEGLSLFYEFDVIPGNSRIISKPFRQALHLFVPRVNKFGNDPMFGLFSYLDEIRRGDDLFLKKKNLLSSPLGDTPNYLAGYMYVKHISLKAMFDASLGNDRDFVAYFVTNYFFHDYELVELLISEETSADVFRIVEHISDRVNLLAKFKTIDKAMKKFEERVLGRDKLLPKWQNLKYPDNLFQEIDYDMAPFVGNKKSFENGKRILKESVMNLLSADSLPKFARRSFIHLFSDNINIEYKDGRYKAKTTRGHIYEGTPLIDFGDLKEGAGGIDYIYDANNELRLICFSIYGRVFDIVSISHEDNEPDLRYLLSIMDLLVSKAHYDEERENNFQKLQAAENEELRKILSTFSKSVSVFFSEQAIWWVSAENKQEALELLRRNGMKGIVPRHLFDPLCFLSLFETSRAYLEEVFIDKGSNLPFASSTDSPLEMLSKIISATTELVGSSPVRPLKENENTRVISFC